MTCTVEVEPLLKRKEAARYINYSPHTLAAWACAKDKKIKFIKIGRIVRYRRCELDKFLQEKQKT